MKAIDQLPCRQVSQPMVSIIVTFFNAGRFIAEAIASVFAQTYPNWELLLVDDGSIDGSTEIARQYAGQRPAQVRYLEHAGHQNRGMSASRNLGIRNAKGEYIAFLDADDVWLPHKLEQQITIMASHPKAAMVYGASQYWHSWTGNSEDTQRDYVRELGIERDCLIMPPTLLTLLLESLAPTPCPSDILLRREIVERVGGFEESFGGLYQLYEDQAFLAKIYLTAPVFVSGTCWDRYRQHPDSCVSVVKKAGKKHTAGLFFLGWLEQYLRVQGVKDPLIWKALRNKRRRYRHPALSSLIASSRRRVQQLLTLRK